MLYTLNLYSDVSIIFNKTDKNLVNNGKMKVLLLVRLLLEFNRI